MQGIKQARFAQRAIYFCVFSKKIKNGKNQRRFLEIILDLAAHKCYLNLKIK